jgi:hypothetical protein
VSDPLKYVWPYMDVPRPLLSRQLVLQWPDHAFDRLLSAGFIQEAGSADRVGCPVCHGAHKEKVFVAQQADGVCRYFVYCPVVFRAEVTADDLRQWTIDFDALANAIARAMGLYSRCSPLLPERLWCLGRVAWQGRRRKVIFARGLQWNDAAMVIGRIHSHHRPIVLVTYQDSLACSWPTNLPVLVSLEEVASLHENGLCLDGPLMAAMIAETDASAGGDDNRSPSSDELKLLIRRQVKAEQKTELTDDLLVAAYKQEGSYRKAATALTGAQMNVNHWAVGRAVQRAGGATALRRS